MKKFIKRIIILFFIGILLAITILMSKEASALNTKNTNLWYDVSSEFDNVHDVWKSGSYVSHTYEIVTKNNHRDFSGGILAVGLGAWSADCNFICYDSSDTDTLFSLADELEIPLKTPVDDYYQVKLYKGTNYLELVYYHDLIRSDVDNPFPRDCSDWKIYFFDGELTDDNIATNGYMASMVNNSYSHSNQTINGSSSVGDDLNLLGIDYEHHTYYPYQIITFAEGFEGTETIENGRPLLSSKKKNLYCYIAMPKTYAKMVDFWFEYQLNNVKTSSHERYEVVDKKNVTYRKEGTTIYKMICKGHSPGWNKDTIYTIYQLNNSVEFTCPKMEVTLADTSTVIPYDEYCGQTFKLSSGTFSNRVQKTSYGSDIDGTLADVLKSMTCQSYINYYIKVEGTAHGYNFPTAATFKDVITCTRNNKSIFAFFFNVECRNKATDELEYWTSSKQINRIDLSYDIVKKETQERHYLIGDRTETTDIELSSTHRTQIIQADSVNVSFPKDSTWNTFMSWTGLEDTYNFKFRTIFNTDDPDVKDYFEKSANSSYDYSGYTFGCYFGDYDNGYDYTTMYNASTDLFSPDVFTYEYYEPQNIEVSTIYYTEKGHSYYVVVDETQIDFDGFTPVLPDRPDGTNPTVPGSVTEKKWWEYLWEMIVEFFTRLNTTLGKILGIMILGVVVLGVITGGYKLIQLIVFKRALKNNNKKE